MNRVYRVMGGVVLAALLAAPAAAADNKDIIDYRINIMKTLGEQAAAIGKISQGKVDNADNLALHAETIAINVAAAKKAFEAKVVGGTATQAVWDNWGDFITRFTALETAAKDVAAAAKAGGMDAAKPKMLGLFTCKSCHDVYRTK
ncbi:MAG: cytochrome c [Rhodospirillaceae bacterium]|nr:cytochrome c [Rhodospirillaceae bacterium]